jgi:hypothetical protein
MNHNNVKTHDNQLQQYEGASHKNYIRAYVDDSFRKEHPDFALGVLDTLPFSRSQLLAFLKENSQYINQFVKINPDVSQMHDVCICERVANGVVCSIIDRGKKTKQKKFKDVYQALDLLFQWQGVRDADADKKNAEAIRLAHVRAMTVDDILNS